MHLKRLYSSKHYGIKRKENKFTTRPLPGSHKINETIPLNIILRDLLKLTQTTKENKKLLHEQKIKVDGKIRKNKKYGVGLMDTIEIDDINKYFRLVPIEGKLKIIEILKENKKFKLGKITNKQMIKNNICQITLHDGRNIRLAKPEYSVGDTLVISLPDQKILKHFKLDKDYKVIITSGKHTGKTGIITKVDLIKTPEDTKITIKIDNTDKEVITYKRNVFVIGKDKSEIELNKEKTIK
jgi:small subunit ribosomal protein S4e